MPGFKCIDSEVAEEILASGRGLLLDMRDLRSFYAAHHPRAIHLDDRSLRSLLKHSEREIPVIIVCYHGHSSQDMAQLFADFGFSECYSVDGGFDGWYAHSQAPAQPLSNELLVWIAANGFDPTDIDARGPNFDTALMVAARQGRTALCDELLQAGASVNLKNKDGNNALWMACFADAVDIIERLYRAGADLDNQNDNGATALIYAASAGKTTVVQQLVALGADMNRMTLDDFCALDVAANAEVFRFLRQRLRA